MLVNESFTDVTASLGTLRIHIFTPSLPGQTGAPKYAGVIAWSEIYQVTEPIRRFCRLVCGRGFIVAAPEIYHEFEPAGTPIPYDDEGTDRGNRYKIEKELWSYNEDAKTAVDFLVAHPQCTGAIGTVGICIGGHLAFRSAFDPRVRCAVLIEPTDIHAASLAKGKNDDSLKRIKEIKGELLVIFGQLDGHIPFDGRTKVRQALNENGIVHSFIELAHAQHAVIRDELSKGRYDPAVTRLIYELAFDLFYRKLYIETAGSVAAKL